MLIKLMLGYVLTGFHQELVLFAQKWEAEEVCGLENVLKKLGINLTCEPKYQTKKLYHA